MRIDLNRVAAAGMAATTFATGAAIVVQAPSAAAEVPPPDPGFCRQYLDVTDLQAGQTGYWYPAFDHHTPSGSACEDIQIWVTVDEPCDDYRVRFFNTDPSTATGWKQVCAGGRGHTVLAADVPNGRPYRVESRYGSNDFYVMD